MVEEESISGVISPLIWVMIIVILLITLLMQKTLRFDHHGFSVGFRLRSSLDSRL